MKKKKVTYNELMERLDFTFGKLMELERGINYLHTLVVSYISCNKHEEKLKTFLKKETKKDGQTKSDNTKGDRKDQSGDTNPEPKSKQTREEHVARPSKDFSI
tara:strand:+ start:407 stop:715 length:309 start_codon:yes stop_codon:yes gene_type:complete